MGGACRAYGVEERCIRGFEWGNQKERDHLGDPGLDGRIILRWAFRKCVMEVCTGSIWLRIVTAQSV